MDNKEGREIVIDALRIAVGYWMRAKKNATSPSVKVTYQEFADINQELLEKLEAE